MALDPWKRRIVTAAGLQTYEGNTLRGKKTHVGQYRKSRLFITLRALCSFYSEMFSRSVPYLI